MSKKVQKIACANCGKPFAPKVKNARYCSPKCYMAAKIARKRKARKEATKAAPKKAVVSVKVTKAAAAAEKSEIKAVGLMIRLVETAIALADEVVRHPKCGK